MNKPISITLEANDWGQIIDGLTCRAEQYEQTADFYEHDHPHGNVLDVRDAAEARELAGWYRRLVAQIRAQLRG